MQISKYPWSASCRLCTCYGARLRQAFIFSLFFLFFLQAISVCSQEYQKFTDQPAEKYLYEAFPNHDRTESKKESNRPNSSPSSAPMPTRPVYSDVVKRSNCIFLSLRGFPLISLTVMSTSVEDFLSACRELWRG